MIGNCVFLEKSPVLSKSSVRLESKLKDEPEGQNKAEWSQPRFPSAEPSLAQPGIGEATDRLGAAIVVHHTPTMKSRVIPVVVNVFNVSFTHAMVTLCSLKVNRSNPRPSLR